MRVFADTSGFLAILIGSDENSANAAIAWTEIVASDARVIATNYVVVETVTLLRSRHGVSVANAFVHQLLPLVKVVWIDELSHIAALRALTLGSRVGPSLVDLTSFTVIDELGIERVLAFDRHFDQRGYQRWPVS